MSTNDDLASRRGRRADQGDRRGPAKQDRDDRWDQPSSRERVAADPYQDQRVRDGQPQRGGYSNFSRHAYPNQPEPALPQAQGHYQEPGQRNDSARYVDPATNTYTPPSPPYEQEPHLGFNDWDAMTFSCAICGASYGQNQYDPQGGANYQGDVYDQNRGHPPLTPPSPRRDDYPPREAPPSPADDYERNFPAGTPRKHRRRGFSCRMKSPKTNGRLSPIGDTLLRLRPPKLRRTLIRLKIVTTVTLKKTGPTSVL